MKINFKNNLNSNDDKKNLDGGGNNKINWSRVLIYLSVAFLFLFVLSNSPSKPKVPTVPLSTVISQVNENTVTKILLNEDLHKLSVTLKNGRTEESGYPVAYGRDLSNLLVSKKGIQYSATVAKSPSLLAALLGSFGPTILIVFFLIFLMRKGGGLGIGGLAGKKGTPVEVPTTRFADIAGVDECVDELKEVVDLLKNPEKYTSTGAKVPKGYLLVGSPGTGKTMLARAVAGEAGVPFYSLSGSDFVEIFVGAGAKRVREIFGKARAHGQAIVFIDEIDAIGRSRGGSFGAANDERENTLNQLLVEMDGFESSGVIMIAATNRADVLDEALTRAGRFDRKITVPVPDRGGREEIFKIHSKGKPMAAGIDYTALAKRTPGMTGADIAQLLNESALEAARRGSKIIEEVDIAQAIATTALGRERKSAVVTERDREIVAWHEAGHTLAALLQKDTDDPVSVSIIPRGPAGGVTWLGGSDDSFMTLTQAKARLVVSMGGRAAEEILLKGDFTQGAHGDLQGATNLATLMITKFGMGDKLVSVNTEGFINNGGDKLNDEVALIIEKALIESRKLVKSNFALLKAIVEELLERETLTLDDIRAIENKVKSGRKTISKDKNTPNRNTKENTKKKANMPKDKSS